MEHHQPQTNTRILQPPRRLETSHAQLIPITPETQTNPTRHLLTAPYAVTTHSDTPSRPHTASPSHSAELSHKKDRNRGGGVPAFQSQRCGGSFRERLADSVRRVVDGVERSRWPTGRIVGNETHSQNVSTIAAAPIETQIPILES